MVRAKVAAAAVATAIWLMAGSAGALPCPGPGGTCSNATHCYMDHPRRWVPDAPSCGLLLAASTDFCLTEQATTLCAISCRTCPTCDDTHPLYCDTIGEEQCLLQPNVVRPYCPRLCSYCPTVSPTMSPTRSPTASPSGSPTTSPSTTPSSSPTESPSVSPSMSPSISPSMAPTISPSTSPSTAPSAFPSTSPTANPTRVPSVTATNTPSTSPSAGSIHTIVRKDEDSELNKVLLVVGILGGLCAVVAGIFAAVVFFTGSKHDKPDQGKISNYANRVARSFRSIRRKNPVFDDIHYEDDEPPAGDADALEAISARRATVYANPEFYPDGNRSDTATGAADVEEEYLPGQYTRKIIDRNESAESTASQHTLHDFGFVRKPGEHEADAVDEDNDPDDGYLNLFPNVVPEERVVVPEDALPSRYLNLTDAPRAQADADADADANADIEAEAEAEANSVPNRKGMSHGMLRTVNGSVYGGFGGDPSDTNVANVSTSSLPSISEIPASPVSLTETVATFTLPEAPTATTGGIVRTVGGSVYGGFSGDDADPKAAAVQLEEVDRSGAGSRASSPETDHVNARLALVSTL